MMACWTALLVLLGAPSGAPPSARLEAALVIPHPQGVTLANQVVLHDAARGITIVPDLRADTLEALFDGRSGRLVTTAATPLGAGPARLRLPLGAAELSYVALRDGRPREVAVPNPAAVSVEAQGTVAAHSGRLRLSFTVVQLATQNRVPSLGDAAVGEPVFSRGSITLDQTLEYGHPLLVLLATDSEVSVKGKQLEVTYRRRVGNQVVEAPAPLIGIVLNLTAPEAAPLLLNRAAPVATPGQVRVDGAVPRTGEQAFVAGLLASTALRQAGTPLEPARELSVARLTPDGAVRRFKPSGWPPNGSGDDFALAERDVLTVGAGPRADTEGRRTVRAATVDRGPAGPKGEAGAPAAASTPVTAKSLPPPAPARPAAAPGLAGGAAPGGPAKPDGPGMPGETAPSVAARNAPLEQYSVGLDELQRVAPAAAQAANAVVALRARWTRGPEQREVLMAGTLVSADGLIVTAPAASLAGADELRVQLSDGRELTAKVLGTDASGAILALRIAATGLSYLRPTQQTPPPGTPLVVLGHPYGLVRSVHLMLVGGPPRQLAAAPGAQLQLDGTLAQGNSGGPVVSLDGALVGLAYGLVRANEPGPAISLAVPGRLVQALLERLSDRR